MFFSFDARHRKNSTTSTLWYDPLRIAAGESTLYSLITMPGRISENHLQTLRDRDTWAVCKLWTNSNAAGRHEQARAYGELAAAIKTAFNRVLWREDAPGGPRYLDWIDAQGEEVSYFCDLCQWPPIAVGIASPEQARKIVATADARLRVCATYNRPSTACAASSPR